MTTTEPAPTITYISRRPSWADSSLFLHDTDQSVGVLHTWTAPRDALLVHGNDKEVAPAEVQISRRDDLVMTDSGVTAFHAKTSIFLSTLDAEFENVAEARRFAQAILACCDRIEAATAAEDPA